MSTKPSTLSSRFWNTVKILLALLLIGFVLSRTDRVELFNLIRSVTFSWLAIYVLLFLILLLLKTWQYHVLMGKNVSYVQVLNSIVVQNALSNYLATSAGIASYLAIFRAEHDIKFSRSITVFLLIKIGDLIMIWLALIVSSSLVWQDIVVLRALIVILIVTIGFAIWFFLYVAFFRQKFVFYLSSFFNRFGLSEISMIQKTLANLQLLSEIGPEKMLRVFVKTLALSAVYFMVSMAWIYTSYMVFDFPQHPDAIIFVSTLIQVVSYIPVQVFGGLGVAETSALFFWSPFQISQPKLASFLVGSRLLFYLLNLLPLLYLSISVAFHKGKNE